MQSVQCNRCGTWVTAQPGFAVICPRCGNSSGAPFAAQQPQIIVVQQHRGKRS
jgi:Zn finger protein HypA/HybF involved in hydrogenase expression